MTFVPGGPGEVLGSDRAVEPIAEEDPHSFSRQRSLVFIEKSRHGRGQRVRPARARQTWGG